MVRASFLQRFARRYWIIALTILVAAAGGALVIAGRVQVATWVTGGYALLVACGYLIRMLRQLFARRFGIDILAVMAIVSTVLVGEVVAALIVVLMMTGGEALEDYANRRARHELDALLLREPRVAHLSGDGHVDDVDVGIGHRRPKSLGEGLGDQTRVAEAGLTGNEHAHDQHLLVAVAMSGPCQPFPWTTCPMRMPAKSTTTSGRSGSTEPM